MNCDPVRNAPELETVLAIRFWEYHVQSDSGACVASPQKCTDSCFLGQKLSS
jgi:hypothetical protein